GLTINTASGVISGTVAFGTAGPHSVTITVTDGTLNATDTFNLTVNASNSSMAFNGTNQYVTFGSAQGLNSANFTLETWFRRDAAGTGVTTGTGGIASAIPLVSKGGAESEAPANVNMNYFLGIDASASATLVADFEDT